MMRRVVLAPIVVYQRVVSPALPRRCKYEPTCSAYALQAIEKHGAGAGAYMTLHRLARCQPWCEGGHDPGPALPPALFRSFTSAAPEHAAAAPSPSTDNKTSP